MTPLPASQHPLPSKEGEQEEYVAIFTPFGQDALLIAQALRPAARSLCLPDMVEFCYHLLQCDVGIFTTEVLSPESVEQLQGVLHAQPAWSDIPLILLSSHIDPASFSFLAEVLGNITIIQRPLDPSSLLTVVMAGLRARRKQYQVRDLLEAGIQQQERIEALNKHLLLANERLRRAMTETHHRVKNSLQIMSALVDMQASEYQEAVPTEKVRQLNLQVRALAAVHDVLTQETKEAGEGNSLSSNLLLETLLPMLQQIAAPRKIEYTVEDSRLHGRKGTALALVTNELVLNALKHGKGDVELTFYIEEEEAILEVCDDGDGLPEGFDPTAQASTGLALVQNLVAWDMEGTAAYQNRPDRKGALAKVRFPL